MGVTRQKTRVIPQEMMCHEAWSLDWFCFNGFGWWVFMGMVQFNTTFRRGVDSPSAIKLKIYIGGVASQVDSFASPTIYGLRQMPKDGECCHLKKKYRAPIDQLQHQSFPFSLRCISTPLWIRVIYLLDWIINPFLIAPSTKLKKWNILPTMEHMLQVFHFTITSPGFRLVWVRF